MFPTQMCLTKVNLSVCMAPCAPWAAPSTPLTLSSALLAIASSLQCLPSKGRSHIPNWAELGPRTSLKSPCVHSQNIHSLLYKGLAPDSCWHFREGSLPHSLWALWDIWLTRPSAFFLQHPHLFPFAMSVCPASSMNNSAMLNTCQSCFSS